jgi:hypothetical protein
MKKPLVVPLLMTVVLNVAGLARAHSTCTSVLTADQLGQLDLMIFPAHPFSAHLNEGDDGDMALGPSKRLTVREVTKLRGAIAHPFTGPVGTVRPEEDAALKAWLNANPSAELPAWDATASESDNPRDWVPRTWIGRTADEFPHLLKESGNVGPIKGTTLGAASSHGRAIGVTEHIAPDSSGHDVYVWSYIYQVTVGGQPLTTLLAICQADLVTISDDERELRTLEQQLARAWATRDRSTIERILAREWSVTTPEGSTALRAAVLAAKFDSNTQVVETMTTDDVGVTVRLFDSSAVVRGRTVTTDVVNGTRQTSTIRFTDFFIKRDGIWQMVGSHQTSVGQ